MKKNVYSLVLSEGVIGAVDALAYREGTSRSALINRILAEYLSYTTPEMRMRDVFKSIGGVLATTAFRLAEPSETMLSLRSSLAYKYNPTVRYSLELYRDREAIGALRVSLRTQNPALIHAATRFFVLFCETEERYIGAVSASVEEGRFLRVLSMRANAGDASSLLTSEELGCIIARYIEMLDAALKAFLTYADDPMSAALAVDRIYRAYVGQASLIM